MYLRCKHCNGQITMPETFILNISGDMPYAGFLLATTICTQCGYLIELKANVDTHCREIKKLEEKT